MELHDHPILSVLLKSFALIASSIAFIPSIDITIRVVSLVFAGVALYFTFAINKEKIVADLKKKTGWIKNLFG